MIIFLFYGALHCIENFQIISLWKRDSFLNFIYCCVLTNIFKSVTFKHIISNVGYARKVSQDTIYENI